MSLAPIPDNEAARLQAVLRYEVLDTPAEPAFDDIAQLAAYVCGTPSAVVSLVDSNRQWFKCRCGFGPAESPRAIAFCAHTILQTDVLVVTDASCDPRFADNMLVTGPPHIRFYAGAPLVSPEGFAVGSVAVIDYAPRQLDDRQRKALQALSRQVVTQLELRRRLTTEQRVERDRAARALGNVEAEKQTLVEASLDSLVTIDHRGRIVEFNQVAEATFGHRCADALGRELAALIFPPAVGDRRRRELADYLATGDRAVLPQRIETTALHADGHEVPVELTLVRIGRGEPPRFTGFLRDLTVRKQAEAAVRHGLERFELIARATNDAVWDWDLRTHALGWNDGFQRQFGYRPEDVEPGIESWAGRLHPDDQARVETDLHHVIDHDGTAWTDEYRFRCRDGSYADVLDRGYVIRDAAGVAVRMIGAMQNITDRKLAQDQVRRSEARYRELVDDVREVIVTLGPDAAITAVNRAAVTALGGSSERWLGRPFLALVFEPDRDLAHGVVQRVLRGERASCVELRLLTSTGEPVGLEFTITPRQADGEVVGVLAVGRDVTERKRLEEQLRHSQKMDAIGQLSGGVAHDFNNLLTVIQINATLLGGGVPADEVKVHADEIMVAAERAASLTRQLLLFSRRQVLQPTTVDLNDLARNMSQMLKRLVGEDIQMVSDYGAERPLLRGDVGMLEQVLLNLAVNARDAMPRGGRLTIGTHLRAVDEAEARRRPEAVVGQWVCLTVQDTGAGIALEVLPHVFEPFFTTKDVGKGTGLGLATVYGIVKQHGGWVDVATTPGAGTTMTVTLPLLALDAPAPAPAPAPAAARALAGSETLLVVEDEAGVRTLLVRLLSGSGYTVLHAESSEGALEIWQRHQHRIDLLLTDLVMPGSMNGHELAARLRQDRPTLKVIFTSGYSAERSGEALVEGTNFLQKPYHPDKLTALVRDCLDRGAHADGRPG